MLPGRAILYEDTLANEGVESITSRAQVLFLRSVNLDSHLIHDYQRRLLLNFAESILQALQIRCRVIFIA